mgnify:CR=1 FL=1
MEGKACGNIGMQMVGKGQEIHSEITRAGLGKELLLSSALIHMYAKCGSLWEAQLVFDKLLDRDVVTWTALMAGYTELGNNEKVFKCCKEMEQEGISLNAISYVCILKICGNVGYVDKGISIHADIAKKAWKKRCYWAVVWLIYMPNVAWLERLRTYFPSFQSEIYSHGMY